MIETYICQARMNLRVGEHMHFRKTWIRCTTGSRHNASEHMWPSLVEAKDAKGSTRKHQDILRDVTYMVQINQAGGDVDRKR
jgi:hypothetical protein